MQLPPFEQIKSWTVAALKTVAHALTVATAVVAAILAFVQKIPPLPPAPVVITAPAPPPPQSQSQAPAPAPALGLASVPVPPPARIALIHGVDISVKVDGRELDWRADGAGGWRGFDAAGRHAATVARGDQP